MPIPAMRGRAPCRRNVARVKSRKGRNRERHAGTALSEAELLRGAATMSTFLGPTCLKTWTRLSWTVRSARNC